MNTNACLPIFAAELCHVRCREMNNRQIIEYMLFVSHDAKEHPSH